MSFLPKLPNISTTQYLTMLVVLIAGGAILMLDLSPWVLQQHINTCNTNAGTINHHSGCMDTYWNQYQLDNILLEVFGGVAVLLTVDYLYSRIRLKSR